MPIVAVRRDHQSAAFLDGTAAGKFLIVRDKKTGEYLDPKTDVALNPDRYEYVPAKGTGKIVSWAIVHGKGADGAVARSAVGIVELDEGPWWWTEFQGVDLDADLAKSVEAARAANRSWSEIGAMLGVSKQAAQRKYGSRSAA